MSLKDPVCGRRYGIGGTIGVPPIPYIHRMRPHVLSQVVGLRERFAVHVTDMRPLPRMQVWDRGAEDVPGGRRVLHPGRRKSRPRRPTGLGVLGIGPL